jgi:hypothetical protein
MVTEPGYHDAQLRGGLDHHGFRRNFYFSVVDNNFGHGNDRNIKQKMVIVSNHPLLFLLGF